MMRLEELGAEVSSLTREVFARIEPRNDSSETSAGSDFRDKVILIEYRNGSILHITETDPVRRHNESRDLSDLKRDDRPKKTRRITNSCNQSFRLSYTLLEFLCALIDFTGLGRIDEPLQ